MASSQQQQEGIPSERVFDRAETNLDDLQCVICLNILWKPVACQTCEATYCSACIQRWLTQGSNQCPNRCRAFVGRKCPPLTARLLGRLKITCSHKSNGCQQNIPYDALEKHEIECGYQQQQCSGCRSQLLKKDLAQHTSTCKSIELVCDDCEMRYRRGDAATQHTENICLKNQLRQVRKRCKEMSSVLSTVPKTIWFNDLPPTSQCRLLPSVYKGLRWNKVWYNTESSFMQKQLKSGYVAQSLVGSSPYIVYALEKSSISAKDPAETFSLVSLTAHAAWNDNLKLTITSYRKSKQISYRQATLIFGTPQRISLEWRNVDHVTIEPIGGSSHPGTGIVGNHFVLSEVIII